MDRGVAVGLRGAEGRERLAGRLPGRCLLRCAGLGTGPETAESLGIEDHLFLCHAIVTHGLGMGRGPTVREKFEQVRRSGFEVRGVVLPRVGESSQHIFQVIVDHQMMTMCTADDAEHLQATSRCPGMPEE